MDALQERIKRCLEATGGGTTTITYECEKCKDTEFIITTDSNGYEYARHCECFEKKAAERRMASSGIAPEDLSKGFNDFNTFDEQGLITAKNTAINYYKAFKDIEQTRKNSLLLSGASGRGKTTLGMAVVNNLIKQKGVSVYYMAYRDEVTRLKQEITDEYTYTAHMNKLKKVRVLYIDDLLKGKITESDTNIMYEIINARYTAKLPMIVSTERTIPELLDFDEAIAGRIIEMCKDYTVTFDSSIPNYRMR